MISRSFLLISILGLAQAMPASALTISLVYEDPSDTFFTSAAQQTLNKAASDVGFAITTSLSALSENEYVGQSGSTYAAAQWGFTYRNPNIDGEIVSLDSISLAASEFRIYVGRRVLGGPTAGIGGPGGNELSLAADGPGIGLQGAVTDLQNQSNAALTRGGPVQGTLPGQLDHNGSTANYAFTVGYAVGSLAFDSTLNWNMSYDTLPAADEVDFYTVAAHEILHDLGFGLGDTWTEHVDGQDWTGSAVINKLGTGTNVVYSGLDHIADGLQGTPLVDGVWQFGIDQDALMDPSVDLGGRKYITDLDLAFLQDMGWQVTAVPEPSTYVLLIVSLGMFGGVIYRKRTRERKNLVG